MLELTASENTVDIVIGENCTFLSDEVANNISNEIKEIMTTTQEGVYRLESFTIGFNK